MPYGLSVMYRSLGKAMPDDAATAVLLLPLAMDYAKKHSEAVRRAGIQGNQYTLGPNLFKAIMNSPSGLIISEHKQDELWGFIKNADRKVHLGIDEMLTEMRQLNSEDQARSEIDPDFPLVLMAGERRSYNANQIFRSPDWRKVDKDGALRMHSSDAEAMSITDGETVTCQTRSGALDVVVELDDNLRPGMVTLPHGYGMHYQGSDPVGPQINRLTASDHCDPFSKIPYHKYVPVNILKKAS